MSLQLGINSVSNADYHADKTFLSSSNLKLLLKDPEQFYQEKILGIKPERKESSAFDEGSLTHALILEPHVIKDEFAFFNGARKSGNEFETFAAQNPNKIIMSTPQKIRAEAYFDAFKKNPVGRSIVEGGLPEHTICTNLLDVPVKVRCDLINIEKGYIADVKTTSYPADVDSFKMTIEKWGYDLSASLYRTVAQQHYGKPFDFYFIVIDKKNLICEIYKTSEKTLDKGDKQVLEALKLYKHCKQTGIWKKDQPQLIVDASEYEILEV